MGCDWATGGFAAGGLGWVFVTGGFAAGGLGAVLGCVAGAGFFAGGVAITVSFFGLGFSGKQGVKPAGIGIGSDEILRNTISSVVEK